MSLVFVLVSCSATRYSAAGPTGPRDLPRYVLIVTSDSTGKAVHSWSALQDFDIRQLQAHESRNGLQGHIERVVFTRNCEEENQNCINKCLRRPLAPGFGHINQRRGGKAKWCESECLQPYIDCSKLRELEAVRFEAIQPAVDWVKEHRTEILVGTAIVIAGVAFVAVLGGAGFLVLAPVAAAAMLMIETEVESGIMPGRESL